MSEDEHELLGQMEQESDSVTFRLMCKSHQKPILDCYREGNRRLRAALTGARASMESCNGIYSEGYHHDAVEEADAALSGNRTLEGE